MSSFSEHDDPPLAAPERFGASRLVLAVDAAMAVVIRAGGLAVIVAVLGIFLFILWQILPLFRGAHVEPAAVHAAPPGAFAQLLVDEWSERPTLVARDGTILFLDATGGGPPTSVDVAEQIGTAVTAVGRPTASGVLPMGLVDGRVVLVEVRFAATFEGGRRTIRHQVQVGEPIWLGQGRVVEVDYGDSGQAKVIAAILEGKSAEGAGPDQDGEELQEGQGGEIRRTVHAARLMQKRSLMGAGKMELAGVVDLTAQLGGRPVQVLASSRGDSMLVVEEAGEIDYFVASGSGFERRQRFAPFADLPEPAVALAGFIFGDVSLALVSPAGVNRVFSLFTPPGESVRLWGQTKQFPPLPGPPEVFAASRRTKAFLVTSGDVASLRFSTTESVRWQERLPFEPLLAAISGKNDRLFFLGGDGQVHEYQLNDPHAEASWKAFFGRVWYEGADAPKFAWQSTGGVDDFEPKLSMVPLLVGTLKGTFYALIFAVPIALTAALYTSQFAHAKVRAVVKPLMEVMASLPSVVLGFIAALWLAPILETRVPTVLAMILLVPATALALGWIWPRLPAVVRHRAGLFGELILLLAGLAAALGLSVWLGPLLERTLFVVTDAATGERVADFRAWWPAFTGASFEQRNSLVVGFIMGFAVIPIIFTIAEDSLSNVPQNLRSGSLALGATRWQTAMRVVLPTASAGIFSALMVGLGRAVGETMIVLMATGNTPIMDFNIFSGMRTLSANIAVELPEAPHHGTLYRALFLGGMLLFLMTFLVNTVAELLRQHLRDKYKTV